MKKEYSLSAGLQLTIFFFPSIFNSFPFKQDWGGTAYAQNNRIWGTYYGGKNNDYGTGVATDSFGNVYLAGTTASSNNIASAGAFQTTPAGAFLVQFNAGTCVRNWATYYGGSGNSSVATDAFGNVYLAGTTNSDTLIASGGFQDTYGGNNDAFLVKFDAAGNRLWATYYGGSGSDNGNSVATDAAGNVYLAGTTTTQSALVITPVSPGQSGPLCADTVIDVPGNDIAWNTPDSAAGSNTATYAIDSLVNPGSCGCCQCVSDWLQATHFGITIPPGMIITGVEAQVDWVVTDPNIYNQDAYLVVGGVIQSLGVDEGTGYIGSTQTVTTIGSSMDTWGVPLTPADVESPDFGIALTFDDNAIASGTASVATINIIVYYAATLNITNNYVVSTNTGFLDTYKSEDGSDAFLVKFDANGNRIWGTYYGSTYEGYGANNIGNSVATDAAGNVYLAGNTNSNSFIASGGFQDTYSGGEDAFLVKFNSAGSRQWATYYGGTGDDKGWSTTTDAVGNIFLAGQTGSAAGIASGGFQNTFSEGFNGVNDFLVKFNSNGTRLWATYYGGDDYDRDPAGVATDAAGNVFLTGLTESGSEASSGFYNSKVGAEEQFLVSFDSSGNRLCATYYGGEDDDVFSTVATDAAGNVYLTGSTGNTNLVASDGFQNTYGGGGLPGDADLVKLGLTVTATSTNVNCPGDCSGTATAAPISCGHYIYSWSTLPVQTTQTATGLCTGSYTVAVTDVVFHAMVTATVSVISLYPSPTITVTPDLTICSGAGTVLTAEGAVTYLWSPSTGLSSTTGSSTIAVPGSITSYTITGTNSNGCTNTANVLVGVYATSTLITSPGVTICALATATLTATLLGPVANNYTWSPALFLNTTLGTSVESSPTVLGIYSYTVTCTDVNGCSSYNSVTVALVASITASAGSNATVCYGSCATLTGNGGSSYTWYPSAGLSATDVYNPTACPSVTTTYSLIASGGGSCTASSTVTVFVAPLSTISVSPDVTLCGGSSASLSAGGALTYLWSPSGGLNSTTSANVTANPATSTLYSVTGTGNNGCNSLPATVNVTVLPVFTISPTIAVICNGYATVLSANADPGAAGPVNFTWEPPSGLNPANGATVTASPTLTTSYTVTAVDANNCSSSAEITIKVNPLPAINVSPNVTIVKGNTTVLLATLQQGNYQWVPNNTLSCTNCLNPTANPTITTTYYITVSDSNGCNTTDSVTIIVNIVCGNIFIPNAFSPNGDGQNDILYVGIPVTCIRGMIFKIYDRWGNTVFESYDPTVGWDGTYKGKLMDDAVFVYYLHARLMDETIINKKGNVSLIR